MDRSREFRRNWRHLAAASLGVGTALSLNSYVMSVFAPYMIRQFGWSRAEFALLGMAQIAAMFAVPIVGRLTDIHGIRKVAAFGVVGYPLSLVAVAMLDGNLYHLLAIQVFQMIVCVTTTAAVYSRAVVAHFDRRRGVALGLFGSATPLVAALAAPLMTAFAGAYGWRAGLLAVAAASMTCGVIALSILPREEPAPPAAQADPGKPFVLRELVRIRVFWLLVTATVLVTMPFAVVFSQLKLLALDQGLSDAAAALAVSAFAVGTISGRFLSGIALDAMPAHRVAAIGFSLPAAGMLMLASGLDGSVFVIAAIFLVGLSFGGEGDILPFLAVRHFGLGAYGAVMGLLTAAVGGAMTAGTGLIGLVLGETGRFDAYLYASAAAALVGCVLFAWSGRTGT